MAESSAVLRVQLASSIEIMATRVIADAALGTWLAPGTRVYLPDLGPKQSRAMPEAASKLKRMGARPVPHIAARRLASPDALEARLAGLKGLTDDVLVIAGETGEGACPFPSTMDVLETGLLPKFGIKEIGVAGHPEGHSEMTEAETHEVLRQKAKIAAAQSLNMRIVTQFFFDAKRALAWAAGLEGRGIDAPVHFGIAGPTDIATLMKYAARCGVGSSARMLRKRGLSMLGLAFTDPSEEIAAAIESAIKAPGAPNIEGLHIYPFGGVERSRDWLRRRGNWTA
ncbi:MAG: methylenetetrahydrofolate reductase [Pseudomonadota bacterium]